MRKELLKGFRLRQYQVEPLTGTVTGPAGSTHIGSKSVEVLLRLSRKPHTLVTREEILTAVWGDSNASQESLNQAISDLRQALGDHHDDPKYIQTVPRRGYRLLTEPRFGDDAEPSAAAPETELFYANLIRRGVIQAGAAFLVIGWLFIQVADAVSPILGLPAWTRPLVTYTVIGGLPVVLILAWFFEYAKGRFYLDRGKTSPSFMSGLEKNYVSIFAAYLIAGAGAGVYQLAAGFPTPDAPESAQASANSALVPVEPNSIAVLKLANLDGSDTSRLFAEGLAEDVLDRLARIPGLLVSSRGDSWSLSPNSPSADVRNRLRVAYYLEGSVRIVDDQLRVVAQLIDSSTGFHIVSRSFDRQLEDFMGMQKEITDLVVANLRVALPEDNRVLPVSDYDQTDVDAYILYRRAREALSRENSPDTLDEAERLLRQALEIDPGYAAAHAGLCDLRVSRYFVTNDSAHVGLAEESCASALATSPNLYMVHTALGTLYNTTGQNEQAETAFRQALDINVQDVEAMLGLALVYESQGKIDDAESLLGQASRLQPGNWETIDRLGFVYFVNGRYEEAIEAYRRVTQLAPANFQGHGNLGSALLMTGDFAAAAEALEVSLDIQPDLFYFSNLGIIYYYLGDYERSVEIYRQAVELSPEANFAWLNLGDSLTFSNRPDEAMQAYQRAAELARSNLAVNPQDAERLYELAWALTMLGDQDSASEMMARSLDLDSGNPYVHYYDALIKHRSGDDDEAINSLTAAVDSGYPAVMLANEPHLSDLRENQRFRALAGLAN